MGNSRFLPFAVGAITGALGLATVACLVSGEDDEEALSVSSGRSGVTGKLNKLFFLASGISVKIQAILSEFADERGGVASSFQALYEQDPDKLLNYFYYLDRVEACERLQQELVSAYAAAIPHLRKANQFLREHEVEPVSFTGLRPAMLTDDPEYDRDKIVSVIRMCDATLDWCQALMTRLDRLIERIETVA